MERIVEGLAAVRGWWRPGDPRGAGDGTLLVGPGSAGAVWFAAVLAYVLQLAAFAALVLVRERHELFLLGWGVGMMLRFAAVGVVAFWLTRDPVFPPRPALVSLVAFVFILLMLEPLFLRRGVQTR
jgi:hypothetical protein